MKNTFYKNLAPFIIAGFLIGLFLTLQLKSEVINTSSYPLDEFNLQIKLIESFQNDQTALEEQLKVLSEQVQVAQDSATYYLSGVDSEYLASLQKQLGLTEVSGQGVVILIGDNSSVDREDPATDINAFIHASDLRDLVNLLRAFPYAGLSINEQRVVSTSSISGAGSTILVNHFQITPPFEIKIITEIPDLVLQALTQDESLKNIYGRVDSVQLEFKFKKEENLTIPAYIGGYRANFLTTFIDE